MGQKFLYWEHLDVAHFVTLNDRDQGLSNVQEKYDGYFDTIEYAVFCKKNETENYDAFCREFPKDKIQVIGKLIG